jgi:2-dehydropantoate 2-reductase
MRIVVIGSGGVGGYFGARLAAAGAEVTFVARGAHLEAMRKNGLKVTSGAGDLHLRPTRATNDPADVHDTVDYILVATKLYDVANAARQIAPIIGPSTAVITLLNGVISHDMVATVVSGDRVMPGAAYISSHIEGPGHIVHHGRGARLVFGEPSRQRTPRAERFFEFGRKAGIDIELSADIIRALWTKFVFLAPMSGISCLTRSTLDHVMGNAATAGLVRQAADEIVAVARAKGIAIDPPQFQATVRNTGAASAVLKPSMLVDLERGKALEVEWLSGYVAEEGRRLGVATPVNSVIAAALQPLARGALV